MERPVDLKTGKSKPPNGATPKDERICIIHFASTAEKMSAMTEQSFDKIKYIAKIRLAHIDAKHHLEHISKHLPKSLVPAGYGSHRGCYKLYTNVSRMIK